MSAPGGHVPVLLQQAVSALVTRPDGIYVDGTFGAGGHTRAILEQAPKARVIAIDRDLDAIDRSLPLADEFGTARFTFVHGTFADLDPILDAMAVESIDGLLLDLGVSSFQFDQADRGFSFRFDGPLDMRFDQSSGPSAADLLAEMPEQELADLIWKIR